MTTKHGIRLGLVAFLFAAVLAIAALLHTACRYTSELQPVSGSLKVSTQPDR
jgi:hypothetical protein